MRTSPANTRTPPHHNPKLPHNGPPLHLPGAAGKTRIESTKSWVERIFYPNPLTATRIHTSVPSPSDDQPKSPERKRKKKVETIPTHCKEEPSIRFSNLNIEEGAELFKFCLVGKFPRRRPSLELIRDWARKEWKLRGGWSITLLDPSHVFIRLDNQQDMIKVWPRSRWFVGGNPMKIFKWVPTFRGDADNSEPSTAAVWISLPMLPVVLFQEKFLYQVAGLIGKPVTMDNATKNLWRTNVARVCVEVDLARQLPNRVKIEIGDIGFWQDVVYEKLPYYCTHCSKQGHSTDICKFRKLVDEEIDDVEQEKTDSMNDVDDQTLPNQGEVDLQAQTRSDILNISGNKLVDDKIDEDEQEKVDSMNDFEIQTLPNAAVDFQAETRSEIPNRSGSKLLDEKINDCEQEKTDSTNDFEHQALPHAAFTFRDQTCPDILNRSGKKKRVTITEDVSHNIREKKRKGKSVEGVKKSFVQSIISDGRRKGRKSKTQGLVSGEYEVIGTSVTGIINGWSATAMSRKKAMLEEVETEGDESPKVESQTLERNSHLSVTSIKMKFTAVRKKWKISSFIPWMRKERPFNSLSTSPRHFAHLKTRRFTLTEIKLATKNFHSSRIIGSGGFGTVFRGTIDGMEVAVKSNTKFSAQGCHEFEAEVVFLSKLSHRNLVKLIGYCIDAARMMLVYEFVPRGNLKEVSYANPSNLLFWKQRVKICVGVARGLTYLHENGIVHRDIKTNNILIDNEYQAKISDMGLSKEQLLTSVNTSAIAGTIGYLDPEYCISGKVTAKSDVYSFGVVLFEVLCAKPPWDVIIDGDLHDRYLVSWAKSKIRNGNVEDIVDPHLGGYEKTSGLVEYVELALTCVLPRAIDRPRMVEVMEKLERVLEMIEDGGDLVRSKRVYFNESLLKTIEDDYPLTSSHFRESYSDSAETAYSLDVGRLA